MPSVPGGYQPDTKSPSARRADFDLLRRVALLEGELGRLDQLESDLAALTDLVIGLTNRVGAHASFTFNAGTAPPPIGNQLRLNNASQTTATTMYLSHTTTDGMDITAGLSRIVAGHRIYVQDFDDATKWVLYTVSAAVNSGAYHTYTIAFHSGPANVPFQKIELQRIIPGIGT